MRHFAGNVCYMAAHFLDKNNDTLHADFENALCGSVRVRLGLALCGSGSTNPTPTPTPNPNPNPNPSP